MIFNILLAVMLFSNYGNYGVSGEAFLVYVHKYFPEAPGTCFYAVCEKSTSGATYDCVKKHTENNEVISVPCGLKLKKNSANEFWKIDDTGVPTGDSSTLDIYGNVFIYHRTNPKGKILEVICGTYSSKPDKETEKIIDEKCKFEGVKPKEVDNEDC